MNGERDVIVAAGGFQCYKALLIAACRYIVFASLDEKSDTNRQTCSSSRVFLGGGGVIHALLFFAFAVRSRYVDVLGAQRKADPILYFCGECSCIPNEQRNNEVR